MKVIIAGSRTATDYQDLLSAIAESGFDITEVVCGGARGADALGKRWAEEHGIALSMFEAEWEKDGRGAGHIRNRRMGDYGDALIALWDFTSSGTRGMIEYMQKLGKPIHIKQTFYKPTENSPYMRGVPVALP